MKDKIEVGSKIYFSEYRGQKIPFTVKAKNERYAICTKPFNLRRTVMYTIIDLEANIRGAVNPWYSYRSLWNSINGKDAWEQNPYVFVYEFERVAKPEAGE